jgi:anhydro-N-acetylmuramic acid kinase
VNVKPGAEIYIGVMSGTSMDGIDVAIVDFSSFPPTLLHCSTQPYEAALRRKIQHITDEQRVSLDALFSLDTELGIAYAEAINLALGTIEMGAEQVVAIGNHGQTICHNPNSIHSYTAQLGDPNRIATLTGIDTVADFRRKDLAVGGQAAPLAPAFHRYVFQSDTENRVVINIGGIANITSLPANRDEPIIGFDTGPGNCLLDHWTKRHRQTEYDSDGAWGASGEIQPELLQKMLTDEAYFSAAPPKSTGTDYFNLTWLAKFLKPEFKACDVQATLTELTAVTIANSLNLLDTKPAACFICGGGSHNSYLLERLGKALPQSRVMTTDALVIDPDFVEAIAFAWLARERILLRPANITDVTNATKPVILGGLFLAN